MMAGLSDVAGDERTARMVLSMLVEPNDPVTGRVLNGLGAMETLRLAERDGAVVGLSAIDAQVWRDHFDAMALKTAVRRLSKLMPKATDLAMAMHADETVRVNLDPQMGPGDVELHRIEPSVVVETPSAADEFAPEPQDDFLPAPEGGA